MKGKEKMMAKKKQVVFIVVGDVGKEHHILGVTTSKKKAEAVADSDFACDVTHITITKHTVED